VKPYHRHDVAVHVGAIRVKATPEERRTYWPRYGPAVPPPDIADDRACPNCGYNLRGLAYTSACPECGSVRGMSPSDEPLPFDVRPTVSNYFATLAQILLDPETFGSQVWRHGHLDWRAARRFRRINTIVAASCLTVVTFVLARDAAGEVAAGAALPLCIIAVLVGLNQMTLWRLRFLESDALLPRDPQRTKALNSYLSASIALTPLHLIALYASRAAIESGYVGGALVVHGVIFLVQFLLASQAEAHYLWQIIDMPKAQARLMGVGGAIARLGIALWYCCALPTMFVFIGKTLVSR
jgi:hypothetical protein